MTYDPTIGRWISEDPIGFTAADENLYRYVGNNPTNLTDPSGLAAQGSMGPPKYAIQVGLNLQPLMVGDLGKYIGKTIRVTSAPVTISVTKGDKTNYRVTVLLYAQNTTTNAVRDGVFVEIQPVVAGKPLPVGSPTEAAFPWFVPAGDHQIVALIVAQDATKMLPPVPKRNADIPAWLDKLKASDVVYKKTYPLSIVAPKPDKKPGMVAIDPVPLDPATLGPLTPTDLARGPVPPLTPPRPQGGEL